jgi:CBS domain-containing protein
MNTIARISALAAVEAREVMALRVVACPPSAALTEVATLMSVHQVHAVVVEAGAPGLITARDVVRAALAGATTAAEAEAVADEPSAVSTYDTLQTVAERMVDDHVAHVLVRERGADQVRGVVSSFDIAAVLAGHDPRAARIPRPAPARPAISVGRLDRHTVADVMHRGVIACPATAPLADVAAALVERRTHTAMVARDGGWAFVTDMDVVAGALREEPAPTAGEMASRELAKVRFDATLELAASVVAESRAGHVVAVDGEGFPIGVVSTLDLVGVIAAGDVGSASTPASGGRRSATGVVA